MTDAHAVTPVWMNFGTITMIPFTKRWKGRLFLGGVTITSRPDGTVSKKFKINMEVVHE